ncbi:hypothetical protein HanRHA438_Chr03g0107711 [Helianthus annuus]|nr:hypothetical protein HanRHA438_Chr03g0107711 [Helianthus annuus]
MEFTCHLRGLPKVAYKGSEPQSSKNHPRAVNESSQGGLELQLEIKQGSSARLELEVN